MNAPQPGLDPGGGAALATAKAYAQDLGYRDFVVTGADAALVTLGGGSLKAGQVSAAATLADLGGAINAQRFGALSVVPAPAYQSSARFSINNAHLGVHLSVLAYQDAATVQSQLAKWGFEPNSFTWVEDKATDTQGFVVADRSGNTFVVFRGTESEKDAETDAHSALAGASWAGRDVRAHSGMSAALQSVWGQVGRGWRVRGRPARRAT